MENERLKIVLTVLGAAVAITLIALGFNSHESWIQEVRTDYSVRKLAKYSSREYDTIEGEWYTDYWTEDASVTYYVESVNGEVTHFNGPSSALRGIQCLPPPAERVSKKDLDRIVDVIDFNCYVYFDTDEHHRIPSSNLSEYLKNLNNKVQVKTWYGLVYSSKIIEN